MFAKIEGGSQVNIQGLICNLPPVGKVFNRFTNQVEPRPIYKRSKRKSDQFWEIPDKPKNIKKRLNRELYRRRKSPNYYDTELQEYREREWDRRVNGFWFMNNGEPVYLTGQHYFMLAHWTIEGQAPHYRETDLEYHYFWEYCWNDPNSYGMLEVTQRRNGKSVRAGNCIYYRTSMAFNKKSGIQSKTDTDAKRLFEKQVVNPWKHLEKIFIPEMDRSQGSTPKKILSFNKTSSKKAEPLEESWNVDELESEIDFRASTESAYDGDKLYVYISDECGKVENSSIYTRHEVVKPCMTVGTKIIGKMIYTTTVEDIGDSDLYDQGNFERLWDESDHTKVNEKTKRTVSGLYRYFLSADRALEADKYGKPKIKENLDFLLSEREANSANPSKLAAYTRKYPLVIEEAFWTPGDECIYDVIKIENQKTAIKLIDDDDLFVRGNLHWDGERGEKVKFIENPNGRLKFHKKFDVHAECEKKNVDRDYDGEYAPLNRHLREIGVDPFDHKVVSTGSGYVGSRAAAYLYFKYNLADELSETYVCQYLDRPTDLEEFHEDMVMLAFLTGSEVIIENNKQLLIRHFEDTGFGKFLYHHNNTPGVPANNKTHGLLANSTEIYINENIEKVIFRELLDDWSKFNLKKTTKFDAAMAAGWSLVGGYSDRISTILRTKEEKETLYDSKDFY